LAISINENIVKLSLVGFGCRILRGVFDNLEWSELNSVARKLNSKLELAIFDPSFYTILQKKGIKSYYDLSNSFKIYGLSNSYQSLIQIQVYRRRRRTFSFNDLHNSQTLFPTFNSNNDEISFPQSNRSIIIVKKDIGAVSHYKFEAPGFTLDKLLLETATINIGKDFNYEILYQIRYDDKILMPKSGKPLIREQFSLVIQ